ncbi:hypothetical protein BDV93DRAFT_606061 [Ceratobasidium sp. AG-I]|nr:hypothetical protein BDV93DRAFT_606061 [Ceratobasidium sp. AG-I]
MSAPKLFENAELLRLILSFASTSTCACLVSTSRNFFNQGIIYVWKRLPTAQPLIHLIPEAQDSDSDEDEGPIRLELSSLPADFSRFDVYAPLVQYFASFGKTGSYIDITSSWQTLVFRTRESPLLPNLIEFTPVHCFQNDESFVLWVSTFISPSLKVFSASHGQQRLTATYSTMSIILKLVARGCPHLTSLTLYIGPSGRLQNGSSLWRLVLEDPISGIWQNFQSLRSLVTSVNALDADSLTSLGQLSHLNTLEIRGTWPPYTSPTRERLPGSFRNACLPASSFPILQNLVIYEFHQDDIATIWDLQPLVAGLVQLRLDIRPVKQRQTTVERIYEFLPVLCTRSPQLTDLTLGFSFPPAGQPVLPLDIERFRCLSKLPLQQVAVNRMLLHDPTATNQEEPNFAGQIASIWPNVIVLKLPNQKTTLEQLHCFTTLPKLRQLMLDIDWNTGWPIQRHLTPTPEDFPLHTLVLRIDTEEFVSGKVEELAKYLLSVCPNLRKVEVSSEGGSCKLLSVNMLNFCLQTFHGLAETKRRVIQQHGEEAVKSLLPFEFRKLYE